MAALAFAMLIAVVRSHSNLKADPDGISSLFGKAKGQQSLLSHLRTNDNLSEEQFRASLRNDWYRLARGHANGPV